MIRIIYLIALAICYLPTYSIAGNFIVQDPLRWSSGEMATIETAHLKLELHGNYAEFGLMMELSAQGTSLENSRQQLELVMNFSLPEGSIIDDSWLWVNSEVSKAFHVERNLAVSTYEGIVIRRQDPSILVKNSPTDYKLNVYPLMGNYGEIRRVYLHWYQPVKRIGDEVYVDLPLDILKSSSTLPELEIQTFADPSSTPPKLSQLQQLQLQYQGSRMFTHDLLPTEYESLKMLELKLHEPLVNGVYFEQYFTNTNEGFYQLVYDPFKALSLPVPSKKLLFAVYLDTTYTNIRASALKSDLINFISNYMNPQDSVKIHFANTSYSMISNNWLPADPGSIDSLLQLIPDVATNINMPVEDLLQAAATATSNGADGEIIFLNSSRAMVDFSYNSYSYAFIDQPAIDTIIHKIETKVPSTTIIHAVDLAEKITLSSYYYYPANFSANGPFLQQLTKQFNGVYASNPQNVQYGSTYNSTNPNFEIQWESNTIPLMTSILENIIPGIKNLQLHLHINNGFCYQEFKLDKELTQLQSMFETGKFYGNMDVDLEFSCMLDGQLYQHQTTLSRNISSRNHPVKFWADHFIRDIESKTNYNQGNNTSLLASLDNRILSRSTAFLALEPGDTVAECNNCRDEGGNTIDVVSIEEDIQVVDDIQLNVFPNPFREQLRIELQLPAEWTESLRIEIYDLNGRLVSRFHPSEQDSGNRVSIEWDGTDLYGRAKAAGVYLLKVQAADFHLTEKLVKLE